MHRTLLPVARHMHGAIQKAAVLYVQIGSRQEKTFDRQACKSHAVQSAQTPGDAPQRYRYTVYAHGATICAPLLHDQRACQPNSPICHTPLVAAFSLRRSLQGNTRGVSCVQSQAATHRTLYTAARPLANACLCVALGRQALALLTSARSC